MRAKKIMAYTVLAMQAAIIAIDVHWVYTGYYRYVNTDYLPELAENIVKQGFIVIPILLILFVLSLRSILKKIEAFRFYAASFFLVLIASTIAFEFYIPVHIPNFP